MATTGFDALKVSQNLKAAGFNEAQAGAIVRSIAGAFQDGMIATKSDIDKLQGLNQGGHRKTPDFDHGRIRRGQGRNGPVASLHQG